MKKQFNEKPLPVGIAPPPEGFIYVGMGVRGIESYAYLPESGIWEKSGRLMASFGIDDYHYAALAELCNRLPSDPAEPVKGRWWVKGQTVDRRFDTAEAAYQHASEAVNLNTAFPVYVYQLRAKITGAVNVNRTDY